MSCTSPVLQDMGGFSHTAPAEPTLTGSRPLGDLLSDARSSGVVALGPLCHGVMCNSTGWGRWKAQAGCPRWGRHVSTCLRWRWRGRPCRPRRSRGPGRGCSRSRRHTWRRRPGAPAGSRWLPPRTGSSGGKGLAQHCPGMVQLGCGVPHGTQRSPPGPQCSSPLVGVDKEGGSWHLARRWGPGWFLSPGCPTGP